MNRQFRSRNLPKSILCLLLVLMAAFPGSTSRVQAASGISRRAIATATNGTGLAKLVLAKPAGTKSGDVLVAQVVIRSADTLIAPPSGWQRIVAVKANVGIKLVTYYKAA